MPRVGELVGAIPRSTLVLHLVSAFFSRMHALITAMLFCSVSHFFNSFFACLTHANIFAYTPPFSFSSIFTRITVALGSARGAPCGARPRTRRELDMGPAQPGQGEKRPFITRGITQPGSEVQMGRWRRVTALGGVQFECIWHSPGPLPGRAVAMHAAAHARNNTRAEVALYGQLLLLLLKRCASRHFPPDSKQSR